MKKIQPSRPEDSASPAAAQVTLLRFVAHGTVMLANGQRVPADLHDDDTITRMDSHSNWVDAKPSEYATFIEQP